MKKFYLILLMISISLTIFAGTVLQPGDIAFTGVNMDGTDQFSIVFLADIENGTEIKFTDKGWTADNTWRSYEGIQTWTADRAYSKGEEIVIETSLSLTDTGDQVIAYQNDSDMIAAINDEGAHVWQDDATSSNTSALPQGLVNGVTCVALAETDNIKYNRSVTEGTRDELLAAINNWENWSGSNTTAQTLSTAGYTVNDSSLPVELSSFNVAQLGTNSANIQWTTQSETNMLGFNIFRNTSANMQTSQKINSVIISANNSSESYNYEFHDDIVTFPTEYYYWLESVDLSGETETFGPISFILMNDIGHFDGNDNVLTLTKLGKNYPNPFNPTTTINFILNENKLTKINIYNVKGELVKSLFKGIAKKGLNQVVWNGENENGRTASGGIYFYKMETGNYHSIRKMILLK